MYKCKLATTKEKLKFIEQYCRRAPQRVEMIKEFRIDVEAYEELPPWHGVYNATGSAFLLKDSIIMLKVSDMKNLVQYYPVFSEKLARDLLAKWGVELPPKMSAFANDGETDSGIHYENASLRHLLEFSRLFMISQNRLHTPMAYGFNNLYKQLHEYPYSGVCVDTVRLVNSILGDFINNNQDGRYVNCDNLQDFIIYIRNKYKLLVFKSSDFSALHRKMQLHYPEDTLYF